MGRMCGLACGFACPRRCGLRRDGGSGGGCLRRRGGGDLSCAFGLCPATGRAVGRAVAALRAGRRIMNAGFAAVLGAWSSPVLVCCGGGDGSCASEGGGGARPASDGTGPARD